MKHVMSRMVSSLSNNDYVDMSGNYYYVDMGSLVKNCQSVVVNTSTTQKSICRRETRVI